MKLNKVIKYMCKLIKTVHHLAFSLKNPAFIIIIIPSCYFQVLPKHWDFKYLRNQ